MAGMIAGCITVTGLASTIINVIVLMAGDMVIVGLVFTMPICLPHPGHGRAHHGKLLHHGLHVRAPFSCSSASIPSARTSSVFYFGIAADITPPVALAAYAASAIAKSRPMATAVKRTKLGIAKFVVPYIFAFSPVLLLVGDDVTAVAVVSNTLHGFGRRLRLECALTNTLFIIILTPVFRIIWRQVVWA